jgi:hypothetical protein
MPKDLCERIEAKYGKRNAAKLEREYDRCYQDRFDSLSYPQLC